MMVVMEGFFKIEMGDISIIETRLWEIFKGLKDEPRQSEETCHPLGRPG